MSAHLGTTRSDIGGRVNCESGVRSLRLRAGLDRTGIPCSPNSKPRGVALPGHIQKAAVPVVGVQGLPHSRHSDLPRCQDAEQPCVRRQLKNRARAGWTQYTHTTIHENCSDKRRVRRFHGEGQTTVPVLVRVERRIEACDLRQGAVVCLDEAHHALTSAHVEQSSQLSCHRKMRTSALIDQRRRANEVFPPWLDVGVHHDPQRQEL
jgi:hypothetical protein